MCWLKILLLCIVGLSCLLNLIDVGRGERMRKVMPLPCAIAAVVEVLLFWGIWALL